MRVTPSFIFLVLLLFSIPLHAERYAHYPLTVAETISVNDAGKILAVDGGGNPVILLPDETDPANHIPTSLTISTLSATAASVTATGLNNASEDETTETISGWYVEADNTEHAIYWRQATATTYTPVALPDFEYRRVACTGNAQRDPPDCFDSGFTDKDDPRRFTIVDSAVIQLRNSSNCAKPFPFQNEDPEDDADERITVIAVECDTQSRAYGVNDEGMIVGVSVRDDSTERPVYWVRVGTDGDEPDQEPTYFAYDLGFVYENNARTDREGRALTIEQQGTTILGELKFGGFFYPVAWFDITAGEYVLPVELYKDTNNTQFEVDSSRPLYFAVTANSIAGEGLSGWFQDGSGAYHAMNWVYATAPVTNLPFIERTFAGLDPRIALPTNSTTLPEHKLEHRLPNGMAVGAAFIPDPADANNRLSRAFIYDSTCGESELNELIKEPDFNLNLDNATKLSRKSLNTLILATGTYLDTGVPANFILKKDDVKVDLQVNMFTDHDTLVVGQKHTYTVIVYNNSNNNSETVDDDNYATCVTVKLAAAAPIREKTAEELKLDPSETLVYKEGGLSFISAVATGETFCEIGYIDIECIIKRLDPNQSVTITIVTEPRALLADRKVRTVVGVEASESDTFESDNSQIVFTNVTREGCFIATAAYGSYFEPHVMTLRSFRDNVLLKSDTGRWLVEKYYAYSPSAADWLDEHPAWKTPVRIALMPVVWSLENAYMAVFLTSGFVIAWVHRRRKKTLRRLMIENHEVAVS